MSKIASNSSFWRENSLALTYPKLQEKITTEVCIIGGGIAGLTSAYLLLKSGIKVTVLESRFIGAGESGNTSAHLSNALDDGYSQIIKMHGIKNAKLIAESHTAAINKIEEIYQNEKINCDFKRVDGILFPRDENDKDTINTEFDAAKRCGLRVSIVHDQDFGYSLLFNDQAQFHPGKYLQALAKKIHSMGGQIFENTSVEEIQTSPLCVLTHDKIKVLAKNIITTTDGQFFSPLSTHFKVKPMRSYIIGIIVLKDAIKSRLIWDTADPYHYVRTTPYDENHDLLIVGGEDHRVGVMPKNNPYQHLLTWTYAKFPNLSATKKVYQWSGQIIEPLDYIAYIGRNPKHKNIFMATGDSGHGLTHGTIAGMLFTDLILGKPNPWEKIYKINRLPFRALKNLFFNIIYSFVGYIKFFLPQFTSKPEAGQGKIIQCGFKKLAVYKDEKGDFKSYSGFCSHLGGILTWNELEKSWDCPAHGSRFDVQGQRLNVPAMHNLRCIK